MHAAIILRGGGKKRGDGYRPRDLSFPEHDTKTQPVPEVT